MKTQSNFLRIGFIVLLLNSGYLFSFATPSIFYVTNVLLHVFGGLLLAVITVIIYWKHRQSRLVSSGFLVTIITGFTLIALGGGSSTHFLLITHIAIGTLTALVITLIVKNKLFAVALVGAALLPLSTMIFSRTDHIPINSSPAPVSMDGESMGGSDGPFYPSAAETASGTTIPAEFFMGSEECGRCHFDIYKQWDSSAHHKASFNNQWYRKSIEYMQSIVGIEPSKWCGGCHDHAVLFSGMMDNPVEEFIDLPEAHAGLSCTSCHSIVRVKDTMGNAGFVIEYPELHDLATSKNSLVRAVHDLVLHLDPEPHRTTFMKPLHKGDSSAFCSSCHKVHLDVPVNQYRWLRGFNSYDNWQASGVSGEGARSFYYPEKPQTCTDCHMPLVKGSDPSATEGLLRSHRFASANTAIPTAYGDTEQLEAVKSFLQDNQVSVDLFALVRSEEPETPPDALIQNTSRVASTFAVGEEAAMTIPSRMGVLPVREEIIAPLNQTLASVVPGEAIRIDAVVRTRNVGHFFPGGTVDAFDVWLELKAVDNNDKVLFWSGYVEDNGKGPVESSAHYYRSFLLDGKGQPINKRNAWAARSLLYVQLIPPGAANTVRFRLQIPEDVGNEVRLEAKLNYRKFSWWNTQFAYAGVRDVTGHATADYDLAKWTFDGDLANVSGPLKNIPDVPIITMASDNVRLLVNRELSVSSPARSVYRTEDTLRWNDYGIGLLLQGDLKSAEKAFLEVTKLDPNYADGWVNIARVRVQEGDPEGAQLVLTRALELDPNLAKSQYFYGLTLKTQGRYDEALEHFRNAASSYPRDRVVRNQIGRLHFLKREFEKAIIELTKTLTVDPEDLEAHYNLMLSYQGLGNTEKAAHHRKLYLRFKADEASQFLTGEYRLQNPDDNNERLPIHEHRSALKLEETSQ